MLLPLVRINVDTSAPVADYLPLRIVLPETVVGGEGVAEAVVDGWNWKALLYLVYAVVQLHEPCRHQPQRQWRASGDIDTRVCARRTSSFG